MNASFRPVLSAGLLAVGLLAAGGCTNSAEDRVVGIYSIDPVKTDVPSIPVPGIERRIRDVTRNTKLKIRSDHSFVLTGARVTEGTWRYEGGTVHLVPKDPEAAGLLIGEDGELTGQIDKKGAMVIQRDTQVGRVTIHLRKTG
ncbi:MAG: hypothetical protein ACO1SV_25150 [Fimbriimonas sp.]